MENKESYSKKTQDVINLSSMTPLTMSQSVEILGMLHYEDLPKNRTFIITNEELSFEPRETYFERVKEALRSGDIKI